MLGQLSTDIKLARRPSKMQFTLWNLLDISIGLQKKSAGLTVAGLQKTGRFSRGLRTTHIIIQCVQRRIIHRWRVHVIKVIDSIEAAPSEIKHLDVYVRKALFNAVHDIRAPE